MHAPYDQLDDDFAVSLSLVSNRSFLQSLRLTPCFVKRTQLLLIVQRGSRVTYSPKVTGEGEREGRGGEEEEEEGGGADVTSRTSDYDQTVLFGQILLRLIRGFV